jgi:hypothetical protein
MVEITEPEVAEDGLQSAGVWGVIKEMMDRIQRLEATVGYIIHTQKIASPIVKEDEA